MLIVRAGWTLAKIRTRQRQQKESRKKLKWFMVMSYRWSLFNIDICMYMYLYYKQTIRNSLTFARLEPMDMLLMLMYAKKPVSVCYRSRCCCKSYHLKNIKVPIGRTKWKFYFITNIEDTYNREFHFRKFSLTTSLSITILSILLFIMHMHLYIILLIRSTHLSMIVVIIYLCNRYITL